METIPHLFFGMILASLKQPFGVAFLIFYEKTEENLLYLYLKFL